jgi:hypothetical protein
MGYWCQVTLSAGAVAGGAGAALQNEFSVYFSAAGSPKSASMFQDKRVMRNIYCFSPLAADIAKPLINAYGGTTCEPPERSNVYLLMGGNVADVPFADNEPEDRGRGFIEGRITEMFPTSTVTWDPDVKADVSTAWISRPGSRRIGLRVAQEAIDQASDDPGSHTRLSREIEKQLRISESAGDDSGFVKEV